MQKFLLYLTMSLMTVVVAFSEDEKEVFKLITYNVLADTENHLVRLPALFKILKNSNADIIALQEVTPWFIKELEKEEWFKKYYVPKKKGQVISQRGLLILSKTPIDSFEYKALPSRQGRGSLIVKTQLASVPFYVGTCHLDSFLEDGLIRSRQLDLIFNNLSKHQNALFMGDFNFGDKEFPETKHLHNDFIDVWLQTNKSDNGFTWNIEKSKMAKDASFPAEKSRRLDRVLLKSNILKPEKTKIIGSKPIKKGGDIFPSDHFGLFSSLIKKEIKIKTETKKK